MESLQTTHVGKNKYKNNLATLKEKKKKKKKKKIQSPGKGKKKTSLSLFSLTCTSLVTLRSGAHICQALSANEGVKWDDSCFSTFYK
jgi:hypothetical protein